MLNLFTEAEIQTAQDFFKETIRSTGVTFIEDEKVRACGIAQGLGFSDPKTSQLGFRVETGGKPFGYLIIGKHRGNIEHWIFQKGEDPRMYMNGVLQNL